MAETESAGTSATTERTPPPTPSTEPTTTTTTAPTTTTESPLTASGVAFASQITGEGRAIEPAVRVPEHHQPALRRVAGRHPAPGLELSVDDPDPDTYYAYIRTGSGSNLSTFGWRWFYRGDLVVEYEAEANPAGRVRSGGG